MKIIIYLFFFLLPLLSYSSIDPAILAIDHDSEVTVYATYDGKEGHHETRGRGTVYKTDQDTWILTCKHCVQDYPGNTLVQVADSSLKFKATIYRIFFHADMAIIRLPNKVWPTHVITAPVEVGQSVYIFKYYRGTFFDDLKIPLETSNGFVLEGPHLFYNIWEGLPFWVATGNYDGPPGSSGGGVFNEKGELIGVHTHTVSNGTVLFAPITKILEEEKK